MGPTGARGLISSTRHCAKTKRNCSIVKATTLKETNRKTWTWQFEISDLKFEISKEPTTCKKAPIARGLLLTVATGIYFGKRLQGIGWKPLNTKSAPTAIGWSEVTLTEKETLVTPSNPGPPVVGVTKGMFLVLAAASGDVAAPASPG